jgi:hypothetical protein
VVDGEWVLAMLLLPLGALALWSLVLDHKRQAKSPPRSDEQV